MMIRTRTELSKSVVLAIAVLALPGVAIAQDIGSPDPEVVEGLYPGQDLFTLRPAFLSQPCVLGRLTPAHVQFARCQPVRQHAGPRRSVPRLPRLYAPLEPILNKTWRWNDIERIE